MDFYPRSPCGERRARRASRQQPAGISIHALLAESDSDPEANSRAEQQISIHALLAESDQRQIHQKSRSKTFLSTLSLRRATPRGGSCYLDNIISIHALLAESDSGHCERLKSKTHFYPRSPCGERLVNALILANAMLFLSTLSLRRATRIDPDQVPG